MNEKQVQEQVMKAQGYAVSIEHILSRIFNCERFGFGGQVNSDRIRRHPFLSITQGLAYIYATSTSEKRSEISNFNNEYFYYEEMSLDTILSFDTSEKVIDKCTIGINAENGLLLVEKMLEDFRKICD